MYPGVYRVAGVPPTWKQSLLAACFAWGDDVAISHRAAAALHEFVGFRSGEPELIVPRKRERALPHLVHRPRSLDKVDITEVESIPVTTPTRTLIDVASCVDADLLEETLDDALRRRLVSLRMMRRRMMELGARKLLTKLVEERAHGVTESRLETRVLRALRAAALPRPAIQPWIGRYRVDFAYLDARVIIECDGYKYHSGRRVFDADRKRLTALAAQGWIILHATWTTIDDVVQAVAAVLD